MKKTSSNNPGKKLFVLLFVLPLVVLSVLGAAAFPGGSGLAAANEEVVSSYRSVHEKISAVMPPAGPQQAAAMPLLAVSLSSGDLAVLGYNSDGAADDVAIVALASIPAGTIVNANSLPGTSAGSLTSLSNFGDQILIYQTVDDTSGGTPTIIYAFNNNVAALDTVGQWQTTVTDQISESNLPAGTTEVTTSGGAGNAFGLLGEVDNLVYTGPTTYADKATWLSWIHTVANWTTSNTVPQDIAPGGANLPTSVPVGVLGPTPTDTPTPIPTTPTSTDTPTPIPPTPTPTDTPTPIPPTPTPTATDTPTLIPPTPTPTATDTPTPIPPTPTPTDTPTPIPPTPTPTNTPIPQPLLYVSSSSSGRAGGVSFTDDDILSYDPSSSTWSMVFDGSDVGLDEDLNGFLLLNDGSILITVKESDTLPGIGSVDDSDIVQFFPISLGDHTAGTFTLFFDGSDVGLTTNGEGVDSIGVSPDGRLVVSTEDTFNVPGVSGEDEDLLVFNVTSFGPSTAGSFSLYFDGSDVELNNEDVEGTWIDPVNNDIYLTVSNLFSVTGASGDGADVFTCSPSSLGDTTACTYSLYWDGSAVGFGGENTDGLSLGSDANIVVPGAGPTPTNTPVPPTPTPTNTPTPIPPTPTPTDTVTPTPTITPGGPTFTPTPIPPTPTPTDTATAIPPTPTNTPVPPTPTPTNTPLPSAVILLGSSSSGTVGGVKFNDEDILAYDTGTGTWSWYFDGSDVGLNGDHDLKGFLLLADGSILMTFDDPFSLAGVGTVDDSDILQFVPSSLGANTSGTWSLYFDGSDVGLTTSGEDIDAIGMTPDGRLVISTTGSLSVPGVSGNDEDLLAFTAASLGPNTSGSFELYFDGSDVDLSNSGEDVGDTWIDQATGKVYLSTQGSFSVTGVSGTSSDIFTCVPGSLGSSTSCTFSMFWDGSANGFSLKVDGFSIDM